jgi:ribose transport system permease protein
VSEGRFGEERPNDLADRARTSSDDLAGAPAAPTTGDQAPDAPLPLRIGLLLLRIGPAIGLVALIVVLSVLSPVFLSARNIGNLLSQSAVICVLAMGQLLVIVTRGIDLSVGSTLALGTVTGAMAFAAGGSTALVIAVMLLTGLAVGAVNGIVFVKGRLPHAFIITLATLSIARGLALWLSDGQPIQGMPQAIQTLGGDILFGWLPVSTLLVAAVAAVAVLLTTRLVWGRWIYSVGGNPEAARRVGIPVGGVLISVYVLSGLMAGVAALLTAGRTNAGAPTFGALAELDAIAAVIIGGASFLGGRGHVGNAIVGAVMIGVIRNGMNLLNVDSFFQPMVIGVVIVLAVEADVIRNAVEARFRVLEAVRA